MRIEHLPDMYCEISSTYQCNKLCTLNGGILIERGYVTCSLTSDTIKECRDISENKSLFIIRKILYDIRMGNSKIEPIRKYNPMIINFF